MSLSNANSLSTRPRVEHTDLAVPTRSDQECARGVEGQALDSIIVSREDGLRALGAVQVPKFDGVLASGGCEDVLRRRVEQNLADATGCNVDARNRVKVAGLPTIKTPSLERVRVDLPDHSFAIIACRRDDGVIEGGPVCIEHGASVAAREGDDVGDLEREGCRKARER